jgi:hypothetical protein
MKTWTVYCLHDDNEKAFEVEGDNYGEAACEALAELGWAIVIPEDDSSDEEQS